MLTVSVSTYRRGDRTYRTRVDIIIKIQRPQLMQPEVPAPRPRRRRRRRDQPDAEQRPQRQRLTYSNEQERHLVYRGDQRQYEAVVQNAPLPLGLEPLLRQLTDFLRFIEELTDAVLRRVQYDEDELDNTGLATIAGGGDDDPEEDMDVEEEVDYAHLVHLAQLELQQQPQQSPGQQQPQPVAVQTGLMLQVAWRWHDEICERHEPMTGLYAHCWMLSWSAFCKLFYLATYEQEASYRLVRTQRAEQYQYCAQVQRQENVVVSSARLCDYSVEEVWASLQQIVPSLYRNAYNAQMKTYLHGLFFRYCAIMCTRQHQLHRVMDNPLFVKFSPGGRPRDRSGSDDQEEEDYSGSDSSSEESDGVSASSGSSDESSSVDGSENSGDEEEEEDFDAHRKLLVPLGPGCWLRYAYFQDGQLAFRSQLKRVLLSETLGDLAERRPLRLRRAPSAETLQACETALWQAVRAMATHRDLKRAVNEPFKSEVMQLYVYHGEMERYRIRWPHAPDRAAEVLALLRPADSQACLHVQDLTIQQLLQEPQRYERESVLLCKGAQRQWLEMKQVQRAEAIDKCFLMEEMVSLSELDQRVAALSAPPEPGMDERPEPPPMLLRLVKLYYVVRQRTGDIYRTTSFGEAYLLWLTLLVRDGHLREKHLHERLKSCLTHFKPR